MQSGMGFSKAETHPWKNSAAKQTSAKNKFWADDQKSFHAVICTCTHYEI